MLERAILRRLVVRVALVLVAEALGGVDGMFGERRRHRMAFVLPRRIFVLLVLLVPARKETIGFGRAAKPRIDDGRDVRVVEHVLAEPQIVLEDVPDDAAEERDIGPG